MNVLSGFVLKEVDSSISSVFVVGPYSSLFHLKEESKDSQWGVKRLFFVDTTCGRSNCDWRILLCEALIVGLLYIFSPGIAIVASFMYGIWWLFERLWYGFRVVLFSASDATLKIRRECYIRMSLEKPDTSSRYLWNLLKTQLVDDYSLQVVDLPLPESVSSNVILHDSISLLQFLTAVYEERKIEDSGKVQNWGWALQQIRVNPHQKTILFEPH